MTTEGYSGIQFHDPDPVLTGTQPAVLLVFMPSERTDRPQRAALTALTEVLQEHLGGLLRILRVDETANPDVVQSFAVAPPPAFVLVRRGVELWRQESIPDEATPALSIRRLLTA